MEEIKIIVADKIASVEDAPTIICGNSDYVVNFTFDDEWADKNKKTAHFVYYQDGLKKNIPVEFEGNTCNVPVLVNTEQVSIGVSASGMMTTTGAKVRCEKSILCEVDKEEIDLYTKGKTEAYDEFWDGYQDNGNRTDYTMAFSGVGWTDETYNPKYPINATHCCRMFAYNEKITNTKVPIVLLDDIRRPYDAKEYSFVFMDCKALKTIPSLTISRNVCMESAFAGCTALEHIGIQGEIWQTFDVSYSSNLSIETLIQIVKALKNFRNDPDPEIQAMADQHTLILTSDHWDLFWETPADDYMSEYGGFSLGDVLTEKGWIM